MQRLPIRNAEVFKCKNPGPGRNYFLFIESIVDSVFSISDGKIIHTSKDPHENKTAYYTVLIRDSSKGYSYINIINPQFKEGDMVNKGSLIGFATKSIKTNKYSLILMIINGIIRDSPFLDVERTWELLKAEDK